MKKTLLFLIAALLFFAPHTYAQKTANLTQVAVVATSSAIPSTCSSLSAVFSINVTEMDTQNNIVTIYTDVPWSPSSAQLAQLTQLIEIGQPLAITTQPQSQTVTAGGSVTFTVATNASAPSYQWQFNSGNLSGQTNATLTLTNVQSANAGNYSVIVTNTGLTVTSSNATLTVNSP